ncbi:MAG: 16S rRNA (adenine(1518)-N(6)/adenine(1519)-N(6))-dimethyltransferase RsmA [Clostridia bacterium]|nr:16S rRNA (adenine(1518)-N(6)/adenine(1519)-N(6))-dimethyltransferase RsmA [Clostridia bacterium]
MELTNPSVIREIRKKFGFDFKKAYGQNFLTSASVLEDICRAASGADGILEIGPGFGTLTAALAGSFKKVAAIEVDNRLPEVLAYTLSEFDNVEIISGDCMKMDIRGVIQDCFGDMTVSVAANLPYYITTPVITMLLEGRLPLSKIVVMVQKEVAERLTASPGGKDYGAISVLCNYFTESSVASVVPASCFVPQPKVDSAVVSMTLREIPAASPVDERLFFRVVKAAFAQRRKTLLNCLSSGFGADKRQMELLLRSAGIDPSRRGETLSTKEFALISDSISGGSAVEK